jgi:hypothetical protein
MIINNLTKLICAEGARSSKMLSHFLRAVIILGRKFKVLREDGAGETPQALSAKEASRTARGKRSARSTNQRTNLL